ncbi:hypothetical protein V1519DRAFT_447136 [Lipomyces tetrasporus]
MAATAARAPFHVLKNTGGLSAGAYVKVVAVLRRSLEQSYLRKFPDFDKRFPNTYYHWSVDVKQVVHKYPTTQKWGVTYNVGCALERSLTVRPIV